MKKILLIITFLLIIFGVFELYSYIRSPMHPNFKTEITILVPDNIPAYEKAMDEYTSSGGANPSKTWSFIKKTITIPYTKETIRVSAEAAAEQLGTGGGPKNATVVYLKIRDSVAYVVLNINIDGWAGVSFSINKIEPLVEKTLLQFPEIKTVVFDFAPGDSLKNVSLQP